MKPQIGMTFTFPDGSKGVIDKITHGVIEVIPFLRCRPHPRAFVLGVDGLVETIAAEDEL